MAVRRTAELVDALRVLPDTSRSRIREPLSFVVFDTLIRFQCFDFHRRGASFLCRAGWTRSK
jgi:hypothetical protein